VKDPGKIEIRDSRQDRLKQALRENLKRRKSQARGRTDIANAPSDDEAASPDNESKVSDK
jgi:tRNA A37 threonylcarbamoyladenosine dehydratase